MEPILLPKNGARRDRTGLGETNEPQRSSRAARSRNDGQEAIGVTGTFETHQRLVERPWQTHKELVSPSAAERRHSVSPDREVSVIKIERSSSPGGATGKTVKSPVPANFPLTASFDERNKSSESV